MDEFEKLFQKYTPVVYRYLLSLCRNKDLAEELTSETFYQAYLHIGRFRGNCKVETWLCQIAKYAFFKEQRQIKRTIQKRDMEESAAEMDGFAAVDDRLKVLEVHKQLHKLKEPYREVFMLRLFGELTFKEIADICGKTESWAKVTFYRAKNKLIENMGGQHEH